MIVCIGNPVYDFIETPYVSTKHRILSGCSTNACLLLAKLKTPSFLVGRIGCDFYDDFSRDMQTYGIDHNVTLAKETGGFSLIYDQAGNRTLDVLGIADTITDLPDSLVTAEAVLFGPILGEVGLDLIQRARDKTKTLFFLDPQGLVRRVDSMRRVEHYFNTELCAILPLFDFVKANETEAEVMTGINPRLDLLGAVMKLHDYGCRVAIVTLAEAGSAVYDGVNFYKIPAYRTIAKDPTGAGDTYAGSFIYRYLCTGGDLWNSACFASCAASIKIEATGPNFPLELSEVERRLRLLLNSQGGLLNV